MRKTIQILLVIIFLMVSGSLIAESYTYYDYPIEWKSPTVLAMGSSGTANSRGFDALIYNPCGYLIEEPEFNISLIGYSWMDPFTISQTNESMQNIIIEQILTNGFGPGASLGISWMGYGIGVGLLIAADSDVPIPDNGYITAAEANAYTTTALLGGYAYRFEFGEIDLEVGATLKTLYRVRGTLDWTFMSDVITGGDLDFATIPVKGGFAVGGDIGTSFHWRPFTVSAVVKDVGHTRFFYKTGDLDSFLNGSVPDDDVKDTYLTPMRVYFGAEFHPALGRSMEGIFDPKIHVSYELPWLLGIEETEFIGYKQFTFWKGIHAGLEFKMLNILALRMGYNQGYFTAGLGIDFVVGELNMAIFSRETGLRAGKDQEMGIAMELAIKI